MGKRMETTIKTDKTPQPRKTRKPTPESCPVAFAVIAAAFFIGQEDPGCFGSLG